MALLKLIFVCLLIICYTSCSLQGNEHIFEVSDLKAASPFFDITKLCLQRNILNARSRKIICLICKGFDPSCFGPMTTTTTSTTETPTTTTTSTTTETTLTTSKSTTTEAPAVSICARDWLVHDMAIGSPPITLWDGIIAIMWEHQLHCDVPLPTLYA